MLSAHMNLAMVPHAKKIKLEIRRIQRNSPLEIVFCGSAAALVVAVIISGGRVEFGIDKIKCHLPPLGKGISALRNALSEKRLKPKGKK